MPSVARQIANAANAQFSTGPVTAAGKARSSANSLKHGLTAAQLVIPAGDREEFDELLAALQAEIRPQGALQQILFDELAASAWNLRRVRHMEGEIIASAESDPDLKLERLARHRTRIERSFYRSLRELKALQTDAALALTLPVAFKAVAPPLASITQIAKRTQTLAVSDRQNGVGEFWSGADAEAAAVQFAFQNYSRPITAAAGSATT